MKLGNKRTVSLLLVLVMLLGMLPVTATASESTENPWSGRTAVFVGDSITAGDSTYKYYTFLSQSLELGSVTAMGVSGSCISAASDYGQNNQPLISRYENIPSADLIMIFMGTNDYGHETPLGSVEDTQDGTFYGALNTVIPAMVAKHTSSKIVFVTPLHRYGFGTSKILGTQFTYDSIPNGVGACLGDYVAALKTVCANNGVSVIDLHTEYPYDPADADVRTNYMPDGLHPNAAGHEVIAGILEAHIRSLEPVEEEPVVLTELIQGNKFASGNNQPCRASSRINYYLKAGTVITLKDPAAMQWACAKTSDEYSSDNLGYFPESQWTDLETAVVAQDGWIGFTFKYRDETQSFDLTKPLSDYITIEAPHTHTYEATVTAPTCTEQGYTTYTCACGDSYVDDYVDATGHSYENGICTACGAMDPAYFEYTLNADGTITLTKYIGSDAAVVVADSYTVDGAVYNTVLDSSSVFRGNTTVTSVTLGAGVKFKDNSMGYLFAECTKLTAVDLSEVNTADVTDMSYLFYKCSALTALELSGLDTGNVTTMRAMFSYCTKLKELSGYENWDTGSLEEMYHMFNRVASGAGSMECIDLSGWDLDQVTNTGWCFQLCYAKQILLPDNLAVISAGFLNHATKVTGTTYTIPAGVKKIGYAHTIYDFATSDFVEFVVAEGNTNYKAVDGILYSADGTQMLAVPRNKLFEDGIYEIPEGVTFLGELSFSRNYNINTLVLPDSYVIEYVPLYDDAYIIFEDKGNLNHGTNLSIAIYCFTGITDYAVKDSNPNYASLDGIIYSRDMTEVVAIPSRYAQTIVIPEGVAKWNYQASWTDDLYPDTNGTVDGLMANCPGVYIPASLTDISADQIDKLNRIFISRADTDNPFTITVAEGNTAFELDEAEGLIVKAHVHSYEAAVTAPTCTEQGYTTYTCECGDSYVDGYIDATGHSYENGICTVCGDSFTGKKVSILSHSMSTYAGVSNNTAANSTIGSNDVYYTEGRLGVYQKDTWWQQVIDALDMELLVNNSWSGSCVFMPRKGEASVGYGDRAVNLHNDYTGEEPDIIFVYLGCNDFAYYKDTFGVAADVNYAALITDNGDGTFTYAAPATTCEAYAIMLHKVANRYPDAEIYCMTSTARRETDYTGDSYPDAGQPTLYSEQLQKIAKYFGYPVIDLENAIPKDVEIFDKYIGDKRAHANALGMDQISNEVLSVMLGTEVEICHVTSEDGIVAEQALLLGGSYSADVTLRPGYSIKVTMDGKDITSEAYQNGKITITKVTGDICVRAYIVHTPKDYLWNLENGELVSTGEYENNATKLTGTVTDGLLSNSCYAFATAIVLQHDLPWVLEWKIAGNWGGMLLSSTHTEKTANIQYITRTKGGQVCFGTWLEEKHRNYGVDLSALDNNAHVYRLENHIAADGSNMIWIYVDGTEIGPMNNYYIGSAYQSTDSAWVSGRDFVFSHVGTGGYPLNNCALDYMRVIECNHTYENGICTVCGTEHPNLANYEGKVISILGDSISTFAGYIPVADGFNLTHRARYPQSDLLTDVNETWWMQVLAALDAKLGINDSWAGSTVTNTITGNSGDLGEKAAMASLTRIQNLGANGTPDVILFYGGTNDIAKYSQPGSFDPTTAPTQADLTATKWNTPAEAYVAAILRMRHAYPDAEIVAMLPTYTSGYYTDERLEQFHAVYSAICEHYGVNCIDLRECGITTGDLPDGIHPDASGMDHITEAVLDILLAECDMEVGENTVHTVTHKLSGAESSLGYCKGITHGKSFITTITGENVTVSVTMGGVDITDTAYANGVVTVTAVTGDLVITAQGRVKPVYEDHLQQLPENLCCRTNLWTVLAPENAYYTGSAWGNLSGNSVYSITVPAAPGDQIWTTSFQKSGANGGSSNGIRLTWFDADGVLKSLTPAETYAEFAENGCLTAPEGSVAVNVVMWNGNESNEVYLVNRDHTYKDGSCTACGAAQWDTDGDGTLSILAIGNSFSVDALQYAWQIANSLGVEKIVIGNLYIGGCTLATHAANASGDLGKYTYYYNDNGTWNSTSGYKISTALESRSWDYVSMQQGSPVSGVESSYNEDLTNLIAYVQERSNAKLVWHMTWAYQQNSTHSAFPTYNKDQMTMYNAIVSAVRNKIVTNGNFDWIVPNGTAVQNSRTSLLGDTTTRDGYHMSNIYGRYLTGLLFVKTVTGFSVDGIAYAPSGLTEKEKAIAIESVNHAFETPFAVTQSAYVKQQPQLPGEGYILLQPELYQGGYWHPMNAESYNRVISDASNSYQFFTTVRFTRQSLPVGSVLILEDGWKYRPDGWVTDALQTGTREAATQESYVEITEEWWGNYSLRSFNVSNVSGSSVMGLTEEEMRAIFRIYVPEESHVHEYTKGICALCGEEDPGYVPLNGLHKGEDGIWYYYVNDEVDTEYRGLAENRYATYYVANGQIDFTYNNMVEKNGVLWYVRNGMVNHNFEGLYKYDGEWYYIQDARISTGYTGLAKNSAGWFYVQNGRIDFTFTGIAGNEAGLWFVYKGQILFDYIGLWAYNGEIWYIRKGLVDSDYCGVMKYDGNYVYVGNGKVDYTYSGIASNLYGQWYVVNGIVDFSYTGTYQAPDGTVYNIVKGQVK